MTTTLGLWQIVGLTLLTLILAVILNRLVILTVLVLSRLWSKPQQSPIDQNEMNGLTRNLSESGNHDFFAVDEDGNLLRPLRFPNGQLVHPEEEKIDDENSFGSTGFVPGGVSWTQQAPSGLRIGYKRKDFRSLMKMKGSR